MNQMGIGIHVLPPMFLPWFWFAYSIGVEKRQISSQAEKKRMVCVTETLARNPRRRRLCDLCGSNLSEGYGLAFPRSRIPAARLSMASASAGRFVAFSRVA